MDLRPGVVIRMGLWISLVIVFVVDVKLNLLLFQSQVCI